MGVRIRAAHSGALVLKDLHVPQLFLGFLDLVLRRGLLLQQRELGGNGGKRARRRKMGGIDARPGLDDGEDIGGAHVGKSRGVLGAERQDVTLARDGLGAEEEGGQVIEAVGLWRVILGLLFLDGAVVVDKDEGVLVFGIGVALCSWVAGTQVALFRRVTTTKCWSEGIRSGSAIEGSPWDHILAGRWLARTPAALCSCINF